MKLRLALVALAGVTVLSVDARADEPASTCEEAFEAADLRLRPSESRLLDARAALRACATASCKQWMIDDCSRRLADVEARIPSVSLSAEDSQGTPLREVRVFDGDREVVGRLGGVAVEMDPGPHELVAEFEGARVARSIVVVEGKKAQQVVFTFATAAAPISTAAKPLLLAPAYPWARPFAGGLLVGSALALGTGAVFGVVAIGQKRDAHCDAANLCDAEPLGEARASARSATVAFALGGALAAGAIVTYFVFGNTRVPASASLGATKW